MSSLKDYLQLHFIVFIWGFTAVLGLLISVSPALVVFYRTLIAAVLLAMMLWMRRIPFKVNSREAVRFLLIGTLITVHWLLFFISARIATAAVCLAGIATCSFWTSILEPIFTKRKFEWLNLILGLSVIVGLGIIFSVAFTHALGLILGILSAFFGALFTVFNSRYANQYHHHTITFYEMIGAFFSASVFLFFYPYGLNTREGFLSILPQGMDWVYLILLGGICTVYAYAGSVSLMRRLSAYIINLSVNLEPIYGIILAYLILGDEERMTSGFYWGTSIVLLSVLLHPIIKRFQKKASLRIIH